jgi:MFS family permease
MVGAILLFFAPLVEQIMIGRVVVGIAVSISGISDVAYLHEMAPIQWRGSIVSVNEACISLGFLLAFCCGIWFQHVAEGWRHMFGISGYLGLIQLLGMIYMPESPVWLKQQGREKDREEALCMIYGDVTQIPVEDATHEELTNEALKWAVFLVRACRSRMPMSTTRLSILAENRQHRGRFILATWTTHRPRLASWHAIAVK